MQPTISPQDLQQVIDADVHSISVIDVRKSHDFAADPAMIPGAQHLLPEDVENWLDRIAIERDVIVYCVHGHAVSRGVVDRLLAAGYRACLIDGGIEAWKQNGGATVAG